jgi:hypothetical protein
VLYVVANKSQFILNSEIHGINTSSSRKWDSQRGILSHNVEKEMYMW